MEEVLGDGSVSDGSTSIESRWSPQSPLYRFHRRAKKLGRRAEMHRGWQRWMQERGQALAEN